MPTSPDFATPPAPPMLVFDSRDHGSEQAFAIWRASMPYDATLPEDIAPAEFRSSMRAWRLDPFVLTAGEQVRTRFLRTAERVAADARDNYTLMLTLDHGWGGDFDGLDVTVPPGRVGVIDFLRPFDLMGPGDRFVMLTIPRPVLGPDLTGDHHGTVFDGGPGRLLAAHFEALADAVPELPADEAARTGEVTMALVRACFAQTPVRDRSSCRPSMRQRLYRYVNAHLTDKDLSPETIADALGITRSTLYRALPSTGVAAFIQGRRLEAIRGLLASERETRSLAELAEAFDFASHAHLTNVFRKRFGVPPSQARRGGGKEATAPETPAAFQEWIAELDAAAQAGPVDQGRERAGAASADKQPVR
jgi:AraC-like DNA-binding protein